MLPSFYINSEDGKLPLPFHNPRAFCMNNRMNNMELDLKLALIGSRTIA